MSFPQFLSILRARWKAALAVLLGTVGLALGFALMLPQQFTATAAVVVDVKPDPILGAMMQSANTAVSMSTQVDIIKSDRVAQRVVRELKLGNNPQLRQQWRDSTGGAGNFESWAGDLLGQKLVVVPGRDSNVMSVTYTAADPKFATVMANAFVQSYIETSLELRVAPAKQYASFFDERIKALRDKLEAAQTKLSVYQKQNGILATDERLDIENQRLADLSAQLVGLQAVAAESRSRNAAATQGGDQLQEVLNNSVVAGLRSDQSRQEARLQELSARLGDSHPQVVELKASIGEMQRRIETESRRVRGSVTVNDTVNRAREVELKTSLEAQRAKVLKMKEQRDEAMLMVREVESAQRGYDAVAARYTQSSLESQMNQTNITLLTAATEPSSPSGPKVLLIGLLSLVAGLLLAPGFVVLREFFDRRVRTLDDLSGSLGLPVLGVVPRPTTGLLGQSSGRLMLPGQVMARLPQQSH
ncbi:chain length determinant protein EpsF [Sphaerotilus hippei]|uniref:Chain length determinant protein EpsF n=1 Tax=Sphaerotilus hippei TaxID=744406 RepID=A0A318GY55_9BURK|nr:chain length determinant protein EpsF [Sphaerotilus hippei]PXW94952.1 chain length determinant protein EpsF [Sphaerotilus hippei]